MSAVTGFVLLTVLQLVRVPQGFVIVLGAVLGGEFLAFALNPAVGRGADRKTRPLGQTLTFAALALLLPLFLISVFHDDDGKVSIASLIFGNFGIYLDDAAMEVSPANLQTLVAAAELQGDTLDICRGPDGSAVVTGLKVWWHGIGSRSHVELPHAMGTPGVVVDLDTAQARLIRNQRSRCMDLPGTYFESGAGRLTDEGRNELLDALQRWTLREMKDDQLAQIRIIGRADPMVPSAGVTNRSLSSERASARGRSRRRCATAACSRRSSNGMPPRSQRRCASRAMPRGSP